LDEVAEFLCKGFVNHTECIASVVTHEVLDVLEQKGSGPVVLDKPCNIKKKRSLRFAFESVAFSKSIFLADTRDRKWLAGKACNQYFVFGNFCFSHLRNVASERMLWTIGEVRFIRLPRKWIPFAGKDTLPADSLKASSQASDASKKIYESETRLLRGRIGFR